MPPAGTPPRARTRPVFSGTSRAILRGRFQPTPKGYHRIPPRPLARAPLLKKGGDRTPPRPLARAPLLKKGGDRTPPRPLSRAPLLKRGGDRKEKGGPVVVGGPPPSYKLRAFFLIYGFSLIFSGGACGWLRAARRATRARLLRWRFPACPWRRAALPRRPSRPRSPWLRPSRGRGSRCRRAR